MKKKSLSLDFGNRIKELRLKLPKRQGNFVYQREVAEEAGISISSYQQAEKGIVPGRAVLSALSEYFKVPVEYLKNGEINHVLKETPPYQRGKPELQDGEGLYGKTHHHEVEGAHLTVTEFKPADGQAQGPLRAAMEGLGEILESNDPILIPAIQANIRAFQLSARRERHNAQQAHQIVQQSNEIKALKERLDTLEKKLKDNPPHIHEEVPTKQKAI